MAVLGNSLNVIIQSPLDQNPVFANPTVLLNVVRDWIDFIIPAGQDALPVGEHIFNVPYGPVFPVRDWIFDLNPPAFPTVTIRTEVPYGPPPNPFWIDYVIPAGQDLLPFQQKNWPVPKGPYYPDQTFYQYVVPQVLIFYPQVGQVWFVPKGPDSKVVDWQDYIIPVGQDLLPENQYSWPVPRGPFYPDQTFYQYLQALQTPQIPPGKQIWVVPTGSTANPTYTAYVVPVGQDLLPFNQKSWPVPYGAVPGQSSTLAYNNALNFVVNPGPPGILFNQYNWPNPIVLLIGNRDWQNFLTNIPPPLPPPEGPIGGGRYITEREVQEALHKLYTHKPSSDTVHSIAQALGKLGGIKSGISRRRR